MGSAYARQIAAKNRAQRKTRAAKVDLTGFHDDMNEASYHAHQGSLSHSGAKTLLRAPALYKWEREHPVHKKVFDFGSAAHAVVLGAGMDSIYVSPLEEFRTNAAKEEKAEAQRVGLSIITPSDWLKVCDMAEELDSHPIARQLLSDGRAEVSAFAVDEPTGVMRRSRFDWLGATILSDYKSAVCAAPEAFAKAVANLRYVMQAPWYLDLARDLGHPAEAFAFIVQEKTPPYLVEVYELDEAAMRVGRAMNRRALERFRDCTEADLWPGYTGRDFTTLSLPRWADHDTEETP